MRDLVSAGDSKSQMKEEIRHLSKEDRQSLLFSGGFTIDIPPEQGLAMKADLAIPWNRRQACISVRVGLNVSHHRWLKEWGVSLSSEKKQRVVAREIIGENLEAEAVPFTFSLKRGGEEIRAAALCYVPELLDKVVSLLEENDKYVYRLCTRISNYNLAFRVGRLTQPEFVPSDEVWVKLGGDKGGSSFKMNFQIVNVQNTCVFTAFEAPDSKTNLHLTLTRYHEAVKHMQTYTWRYCYMTTHRIYNN